MATCGACFMVNIIHPNDVNAVWPSVSEWLGKAVPVEPHLFTIDDVKRHCENGEWILITCGEGAAVFYYETYDRAKVLQILLMAGPDGEKWLDKMFIALEHIRQESGCHYTMAMGREGWKKTRPEFKAAQRMYYRGA